MGNGISTINIDTNASNLAAAADAANLPSIVSKLIRDEELDVQTALILDKEDISELCSKRMDQKRMMSAQLKLKAVMNSAEQGETKEDDQPVAKILNQPGIW
jgi:acetylglutamate kinase